MADNNQWSLELGGEVFSYATYGMIRDELVGMWRSNDDSVLILTKNPGKPDQQFLQTFLRKKSPGQPAVFCVETAANENGMVTRYELIMPDLNKVIALFRRYLERGTIDLSLFTPHPAHGLDISGVSRAAAEKTTFDFKKAIIQRIREDIRPFLKENGFVLLPSNTYIRERNGLMQIIYFQVRKTELRPWSYFMPVYLPRMGVVNWGIRDDHVDATLWGRNPYAGYGSVFCADRRDKAARDYRERALPRFYDLAQRIKDAIIPEMDRVSSAEKFAEILEERGFLWGRTVHPGQMMVDIAHQSGVQRVKTLQSAADDFIAKPLLEFIISAETDKMTDEEADQWFHEYCNRVRIKYKLPVIN